MLKLEDCMAHFRQVKPILVGSRALDVASEDSDYDYIVLDDELDALVAKHLFVEGVDVIEHNDGYPCHLLGNTLNIKITTVEGKVLNFLSYLTKEIVNEFNEVNVNLLKHPKEYLQVKINRCRLFEAECKRLCLVNEDFIQEEIPIRSTIMKKLLVNDFDTDIFIEALKLQGDTFDIDPEFPIEVTQDDLDNAMENLRERINDAKFATGCSECRLYITGGENFRYKLLPSYKWRRGQKPIYLQYLKDRCIEELGAILEVGIEADDACIMDMTHDEEGITKVLKHIDKDLDQIAGTHYNPVSEEIYEVTQEEADDFLYYQMMAGDNADCYKGCPMVGGTPRKKFTDKGINDKGGKAMEIVRGTLCVRPYLHTFKKGAKAGTSIVKWEEYHDNTLTMEQKLFTWYIKGAYTKGFMGHEKGFDTTSGFKDDVKININDMVFHSSGQFIGLHADAKELIETEMSIQYMIARMLRYGDEIPTEVKLLNFK